MPLSLSVIVPTFRRDWSLKRLLDALKAQTLAELEVIVIDQNPAGYLAASVVAACLDDIRVVRLERPNCSAARNLGFVRSNAAYVLFVDDDLIPRSDFCFRVLEIMRNYKEIQCLVPIVCDLSQDFASTIRSYRRLRLKGHHARSLWQIRQSISAAVAFTREGFEKAGGFNEGIFDFARAGEDWELFARMRRRKIAVWLDTSLAIAHDDRTPGGAEMRTVSPQTNRERCIRAWVYKASYWSGSTERLYLKEIVRLLRSLVLNRGSIISGPRSCIRDVRCALAALDELRGVHDFRNMTRLSIDQVNHLDHYRREK